METSYAENTFTATTDDEGNALGIWDAAIHGHSLIVTPKSSTVCIRSYDLRNITDVTYGTEYTDATSPYSCRGLDINNKYAYVARGGTVSSKVRTYRFGVPDPLTGMSCDDYYDKSGPDDSLTVKVNANYVLSAFDDSSYNKYLLMEGYDESDNDISESDYFTDTHGTSSSFNHEWWGNKVYMSTGSIWDTSVLTDVEEFSYFGMYVMELHIAGPLYMMRRSSISGYQMEP